MKILIDFHEKGYRARMGGDDAEGFGIHTNAAIRDLVAHLDQQTFDRMLVESVGWSIVEGAYGKRISEVCGQLSALS